MMKQAKRVIALLLSIVILVGLVSGHVFAEGETVLVPVGQAVYDANGLFVLNELGGIYLESAAGGKYRGRDLQSSSGRIRCTPGNCRSGYCGIFG